jgi:predicted dehydrogenase
VVWDDLNPSQRISVFDRGVDLHVPADAEAKRDILVSYRSGEMVAPALPEAEALHASVTEFARAVREGRAPMTDGHAGLRVLRILEAAGRSLEDKGRLADL